MTSLRKKMRSRQTGGREPLTDRILQLLTERQRQFVLDPSRYKLARCSRRAGKTYLIAAYLLYECWKTSGTPVLYAGLTRDSAKEAIWPILLDFLDKLDIPHQLQPSALQIVFPNGSKITLFGCDSENARNRLRGRKFKLVAFDETGFYARLDPLVYAVLPMLADYKGTLCLTSSPGELLSGLFYEADQGKFRDSWSRYAWNIHDNPHFQQPADKITDTIKTRADEELATVLELQFKGDATHPGYVREWLGLWAASDTALVYPIGANNVVDKAYKMPSQEHAIGICLGALTSAIVVGRYSPFKRDFQIVDCREFDDVDLDAFAQRLSAYTEKYKPTSIIAHTQNYSADVAQELRRRYQLAITAIADKDRSFHQKVMANDLRAGHIKIVKDLPLIDACAKIVKDSTSGDEIEGQANHLPLALLSLYRRIYQTHLQTYEPPLSDEDRHLKQLEQSRFAVEPDWYDRWE